ncbi:MAG: MBL fold metallo-hydrolase [Acidobacteria bacterium]|nr:MBL fold metallo-hydrolase [Acidobacteriota bacterium]MCB9399038.1 MBL fold metallo-hydrolase [Acidobacteriota bacterium]
MHLVFLGGVGTVTGSKFLIQTEKAQVLVDCGLFQGYKQLRERNRSAPFFDPQKLDAVFLTHAHLDHSGYLPVLYQMGFRGPVYCHAATAELCMILLPDSGRIQEEDAAFYARHRIGKHEKPLPLYDEATAEASCRLFQPVDFEQSIAVKDIHARLQPAGHILGAGSWCLEAEGKRIAFSGDLGRPEDVLMYPPKPMPELDMLFLESTYGDRLHETADAKMQIKEIVNQTVQSGGSVVIPTFAVGRAQVLQYLLASLMREGQIPRLPMFLDSPMAIDVSALYARHHNLHRLSAADCELISESIQYMRSVEESKSIANVRFPHIILAGSGMATGGRVLHHLKRMLPDHRNTVLFAGFQAGGTRGAHMLAGEKKIKIHGQFVPCEARIAQLESLSGHADRDELTAWLEAAKMKPKTPIYLVHGEAETLDRFRLHLQERTQHPIHVADQNQVLHL